MSGGSAAGSIQIEESANGLKIMLPAPRKWPVLMLIGLGVPLWAAGLLATLTAIVRGGSGGGVSVLMLLLWLAAWLIAGLCIVGCALWMLGGREIIAVSEGKLILRREWRGCGRERGFKLTHITNLRSTPDRVGLYELVTTLRVFGLEGGKIAFDYVGLTEQFGAGISEEEASRIVPLLKKYLGPPAGGE